ncbi:penicillin-binding protein 2 [bacterium]|nr:penicillin-binding protein 2 [bacterium]
MIDLHVIQAIRARWIRSGLLFFTILIIIRFFYLQILSIENFTRYSEANSVRRIPLTAARGQLLDANGVILVDNRPSYSLFAIPQKFLNDTIAVQLLMQLTGMRKKEVYNRLAAREIRPFHPVRILRDIDFETLTHVEENRESLPGLYVQVEPVRAYSDTIRASHILGYVGEANKKDLESSELHSLQMGDLVGKSGVEKAYDDVLRGTRGYRLSLVDAIGREVADYSNKEDILPVPGKNLQLTLLIDLQMRAEQLLHDLRGSIVVVDPQTGGILAMVSAPDFPLTVFARHLAPEVWNGLINDEDSPLLNRALQAQLPPGSVYKLVSSFAGFDQGVINSVDTLYCSGGFRIGRRRFPCWKEEGHGSMTFITAIAQSCNSYFYNLSQQLDISDWQKWGHLLGFGRIADIDVAQELPGLLPDKNYMDKKYGIGGWTSGQMANLIIGQGDLLVTPIQVAQLAMIIANKGRRERMHITGAVENGIGELQAYQWDSQQIDLPKSSIDLIIEGMKEAVQGKHGSATLARCPGIIVCGKTGSAQNPHGDSHAWFVGFAPMVNPRIAVAVVIENGGSGGAVAAPVAGALFRSFFKGAGNE